MFRRRAFLLQMAALVALFSSRQGNAMSTPTPMVTRPIPKDQRPLPVLGLGTWSRFADDADSRAVLAAFASAGGQVVDSSPMYGEAEAAVGTLANALQISERLFLASKVWTTGRDAGLAQINASIAKMGRVDLMQIHNLLGWAQHIETLRALKAEGRIRYIGLTHYQDTAHAELERLMLRLKPDFIQINLSIADRHAEQRLLPAAADAGVAVLINRPFEEGALFEGVSGVALPAEARALGLQSWAQVFLAYVLAHPSVTCVLAATKRLKHLNDNLGALAIPTLSATQRSSLLACWLAHRHS